MCKRVQKSIVPSVLTNELSSQQYTVHSSIHPPYYECLATMTNSAVDDLICAVQKVATANQA